MNSFACTWILYRSCFILYVFFIAFLLLVNLVCCLQRIDLSHLETLATTFQVWTGVNMPPSACSLLSCLSRSPRRLLSWNTSHHNIGSFPSPRCRSNGTWATKRERPTCTVIREGFLSGSIQGQGGLGPSSLG